MNPDDFLTNERATQYEARFQVEGEMHVTIHADSKEEAKAKAEAMLEDENFGMELDDVSEVKLRHIWKSPVMYLVTRDGRTMQVSRLEAGDQPRQPDESGF